jgi:hypothetical protein
MRFAGPDVVLFIVGALLLSGSVYGIYAIGGLEGGGGAGAYQVEWSESTSETIVASFNGDDSVPFAFDVNATSALLVTVTVDCAHAAALPGQIAAGITVTVEGPAGSGEGSGTCGSPVTVEIPIAEKPAEMVLEGDSQRDAERRALARLGGEAVGEWTGSVTFSTAGGGLGGTVTPHSGDVNVALTKAVPKASPVPLR